MDSKHFLRADPLLEDHFVMSLPVHLIQVYLVLLRQTKVDYYHSFILPFLLLFLVWWLPFRPGSVPLPVIGKEFPPPLLLVNDTLLHVHVISESRLSLLTLLGTRLPRVTVNGMRKTGSRETTTDSLGNGEKA